MKDKEIWSWVRKEAGHRDVSTSKIPRYVLARLCGIPTLQTAIVYNRQSCSQLSERTGCEGRGMRISGYGRVALPATWCIPENVIDHHLPAEPVFALHGTLHQPLFTWALRRTRFTIGGINWTKLYQLLIPMSYIFVSGKLGSATLDQLQVVTQCYLLL
jgi:hypothetical protein